jgi:hypothetical protein
MADISNNRRGSATAIDNDNLTAALIDPCQIYLYLKAPRQDTFVRQPPAFVGYVIMSDAFTTATATAANDRNNSSSRPIRDEAKQKAGQRVGKGGPRYHKRQHQRGWQRKSQGAIEDNPCGKREARSEAEGKVKETNGRSGEAKEKS